MRLLLPPSETKRDGTLPTPLQFETLAAAELTAPRERVVAALSRYCRKPTASVRSAIGTSPRQDGELLRNASLAIAPTAPAYEVYDGVLFDAMDLGSCSTSARERIITSSLVQSALFGVIGLGDAIPAYRCSADSTLPRIGGLGSFWRGRIAHAMERLTDGELVLDLRSGPYATIWHPEPDNDRVASMRIMQVAGGRRIAVSHFNKATKGAIVRALGSARRTPTSVASAVDVLTQAGFDAEIAIEGRRAIIEVMMRSGG